MSLHHICYQHPVPAEVRESLIELYESAFSVTEYFHLFRNEKRPMAIAIYSDGSTPDHIIFYVISGKELTISNEHFEIDEPHLQYLVEFFFSTYPKLHTIHINNVKSTLGNISSYPYKVWEISQDNAVELPETMAEYRKRLGKRTKANLSNYTNKLRREFPDFAFITATGKEIDPKAVKKIITLNRSRMRSKKAFSAIDRSREKKIIQFAERYGIVGTITLNNRIAAGTICYIVGGHCYADVIAHDQTYNKYSIGRVCIYLLIEALIERGVGYFHMGSGEDDYKNKMLSVPHDVYFMSIFRTRLRKKIGAVKHLGKHTKMKPYIKMIKYNYIWRLRETLLQKIRSD
jgi:hypothetical protein